LFVLQVFDIKEKNSFCEYQVNSLQGNAACESELPSAAFNGAIAAGN
jgi:hypothetical protein